MAAGAGESVKKPRVITTIDRHRHGCPRILVPAYQTITKTLERHSLVREFTLMRLIHESKAKTLKASLNLDKIHDELRMNVAAITLSSGASNIIATKISFEVLIISGAEQIRDFITFDIKIPGGASISIDFVQKLYGGLERLYPVMEKLYQAGRSLVNPKDIKHGHKPSYDASTSKHDQYIRHSEQILTAYLSHSEATAMLATRLRATIRSKYPDVTSVKVYNGTLHIHSNKTCCAPCEYSLLGLMNIDDSQGFIIRGRIVTFGFLYHINNELAKVNDILTFSLPKHTPFRLFTTITADDHDAHHQSTEAPTPGPETWKLPPYIINLKDPKMCHHIHTSEFSTPFLFDLATRSGLVSPSTTDRSIIMSGSDATKGSPFTRKKLEDTKRAEDKTLFEDFSKLLI